MKNTELEKYYNNPLIPDSINEKIKEIMDEDEAYVADELVELCDEILIQLASIGIALYLSQKKQDENFNDFIIQLFTNRAHYYNAGPLYRWSAHMIKDLKDEKSKKIHHLFWNENQLNEQINNLSELRNAVMHGFFVLPAERNIEEANNLAEVLKSIIESDLFHLIDEPSFHFLKKEKDLTSFTGTWDIKETDWDSYKGSFDFGVLTQRIQYEKSEKYEEDQRKILEKKNNANCDEIIDYINQSTRGAISCFFRPSSNYVDTYSSIVNELQKDENNIVFFQNLESNGLNFTSAFFIERLNKFLANKTNTSQQSKNHRRALIQLRNKTSSKIIVIINNIHLAMFNDDHILKLTDLFYENNIHFVGVGIFHSWLEKFFNKSVVFDEKTEAVRVEVLNKITSNYFRFKGPNKNLEEEKDDYQLQIKILLELVKEIDKKKIIIAREFSDRNKYPIEFVHEAIDILSPFYNISNKNFLKDELDELYDFPKEITESSRVLFSIGRRDTKLEYQHKTISNE